MMSKTDATIVVYMSVGNGPEVKLGQTEKAKDNLNPRFATPVVVDYQFELVQKLRFLVGDVDDHQTEMIGAYNCTLGDIVGAKGQQTTVNLKMHHMRYRQASMTVRAEEVKGANMNLFFQFGGSKLDKKDGPFSKSDPYFTINKTNPDSTTTLVYKSDYIKQTLDPVWKPFMLPLSHICGGDYKRPLIIEVWDWDKHSSHDLIGIVNTTAEQLLVEKTFAILHPKKAKKGKDSGTLMILSAAQKQEYSFLEYLAGGIQLNLAVGVDYTASNGAPDTPTSLHYRAPGGTNAYMNVLASVGSILMPYDYDQWVPAYGFGANLNGIGVSHCFAINGNPAKPEVPGVQGMLDAYNASFNMLKLHGPTNMAPLINTIAQEAAELDKLGADLQAYLLLLVITDGEITDMPQTIEAIVNASYLPMSIVIVGVGNADFTNMNHLDSDDGHLTSGLSGRRAARDIVQFVPFNRVGGDPARLAAETLAELPKQVVDFMKVKNIVPRPRLVVQETVTVTTTTQMVAGTTI
jgi:hypothetical protein